jgi:hypothetical protein
MNGYESAAGRLKNLPYEAIVLPKPFGSFDRRNLP